MALSYRPIPTHLEAASEAFRQGFAGEIDEGPANFQISWCLPLMAARHIKWARAICPTGKLPAHAAMVGAVRLKDPASGIAALDFANQLCDALQSNNKSRLEVFKELCRRPVGEHRKFQVWAAIEELRETGNFLPSRSFSAIATKAAGRKVEWMFFPSFKEVRAHVEGRPDDGRFCDLHPIACDDAAWSRVWRESGARLVMERGVRGQAAHRPR
jgi:hypothetical protein